jgi:hypothetical protein
MPFFSVFAQPPEQLEHSGMHSGNSSGSRADRHDVLRMPEKPGFYPIGGHDRGAPFM